MVALMGSRKYPWEAIRAAYLAGEKPRHLATRFEVPAAAISKRASTHNWQAARDETERQVANALVEKALASSEHFQRLCKEAALKGVEAIRARDVPTDPYEVQALAGGLERYVNVGRKAYGLEDNGRSGPIINIAFLNEANAGAAPAVPSVVPSPTLPATNPNDSKALDI